MERENCQKIKLLKLYELLCQETDEQHPLPTMNIGDRLAQMGMSYGVVLGLTYAFSGGELVIKLVVDLLLSILSYQVQMRWVFKKREVKEERA